MDVTSDEIRSSRFQGTRHVYDRREIDAFLHRVAATLEVYERKVAVTQAHVESLEKALDLAHSRARSVRDREIRIGELETALAAAQHNYESVQAELEAAPTAAVAAAASGDIAAEARLRADELVEEAAREALAIRDEAERVRTEAEAEASAIIADAEAAAEEGHRMARLEQAKMLDALATERSEAKAALDDEIAAKRTAILAELEEERVLLAGETAAADAEKRAELDQAESQVLKAQRKAAKAEAARAQLVAEIEQMRDEAAAERQRLMEDAEQMVAEAVARAEIDRDQMLTEARAELAATGDSPGAPAPSDLDQELLAASAAEASDLRRQLAQMRTALSNIQMRFANASELSSEELQLAAALVDLDLHDVDQLVDLTSLENQIDGDEAAESDEPKVVKVKSKWAGPGQIPAGSLQDGRAAEEAAPPAWRNYKSAAASTPATEPAPEPAAPQQEEVLGFYERRLAGLRERLKDAAPPDAG